ncbi:MAG: hypothetical protein VX278_03055, partial [Myxococcota bacterium]|nr:hypothetical protein [Myxococcota bacterium]
MMLSLFLFACDSSEEFATDENTLDFYEEIQPILEQNCTSCHLESGQGIGDFTVYENVKVMAPLIQSSLENGTMPPPAADPTCREYKGSEALHLDEDKKEMILQWIEEGAQEGDPAKAQTYDRSAFKLSEPDLTVQIEEPYTPTFSLENNPANEYRCFSIKHNREEPFYITAIHPIVDNTDLVHHIVIAKGDEEGIIRNSDRPEGAGCIRNGGAFIRDFEHGSMLSGWAPGMRPVELADDTGMLILPDDYIIVQIHYYQNPDAERDSDQTSVAFRTTD